MWSSVDLPAPDGPMIDTNSPGLDVERDAAQHVALRRRPADTTSRGSRSEISITAPAHSIGRRVSSGFVDDAAVEEVNVAIGVAGVARIVRDHADGRAALMQLVQQVHHRLAALRIEVAGRLVGEQNDRLAGDGARDGDALLLSAGQLTGQMLRAMRHADALERVGRRAAGVPPAACRGR